MIRVYSKTKLSKDLQEKVLEFINSNDKEYRYELSDIEFIEDKNIISGIRIDKDSKITDLTLNQRLEEVLRVISS